MSVVSRRKGQRLEREIVVLHRALGIFAERVPLSRAQRYQGKGADVDIYELGREEPPLRCEVKGRKSGQGFRQLEKWLGEHDTLFLRRNDREPLVLLPWRTWSKLVRSGS
jgi:hypothetical protein